jgi:aryl-alcohol dehydrogenase-like predicted oxidoreductase
MGRDMAARLRPDRTLGATGVQVPLVGYGTAPLGNEGVSREEAVRCLNHAIDLGITYLDTSPDYGSEPHVGEVVHARRDDLFLATKVNLRTRDGVLRELADSLGRLRTDHVDLLQIHAVNAWADLEQALAPDGAVAGLEQARREGMTRYIGITGHARPEILAQALARYPFDTVLAALGIADHLVTAPDAFLLPAARERNVGVIAMKVFGHGAIRDRAAALRYSLGLPGVSLAIIGMDSVQQIDDVVSLAARFTPLPEAEVQQLVEAVRPVVQQDAVQSQEGKSALFWLHDTTVMGWQERDVPSLVAY